MPRFCRRKISTARRLYSRSLMGITPHMVAEQIVIDGGIVWALLVVFLVLAIIAVIRRI